MKKILRIIICIVAAAVFCFSGWQIYEIVNSRYIAKTHYESYDEYIIRRSETDLTEKNNGSDSKMNSKKCDIEIDFEKLNAKYPDTVGWLYFPDMDINYPVMQGKDNSYYLNHLPDGTKNDSGSLFADYRNSNIEKNKNYIIYGHNMKNNTMFGLLDNYNNQQYYNQHSYFYYLTNKKTYRIEIIAGCIVESDSLIYNVEFKKSHMRKLIDSLTEKSTFCADEKYTNGDKLVTLSTCSDSTGTSRYILVGVVR